MTRSGEGGGRYCSSRAGTCCRRNLGAYRISPACHRREEQHHPNVIPSIVRNPDDIGTDARIVPPATSAGPTIPPITNALCRRPFSRWRFSRGAFSRTSFSPEGFVARSFPRRSCRHGRYPHGRHGRGRFRGGAIANSQEQVDHDGLKFVEWGVAEEFDDGGADVHALEVLGVASHGEVVQILRERDLVQLPFLGAAGSPAAPCASILGHAGAPLAAPPPKRRRGTPAVLHPSPREPPHGPAPKNVPCHGRPRAV